MENYEEENKKSQQFLQKIIQIPALRNLKLEQITAETFSLIFTAAIDFQCGIAKRLRAREGRRQNRIEAQIAAVIVVAAAAVAVAVHRLKARVLRQIRNSVAETREIVMVAGISSSRHQIILKKWRLVVKRRIVESWLYLLVDISIFKVIRLDVWGRRRLTHDMMRIDG